MESDMHVRWGQSMHVRWGQTCVPFQLQCITGWLVQWDDIMHDTICCSIKLMYSFDGQQMGITHQQELVAKTVAATMARADHSLGASSACEPWPGVPDSCSGWLLP